MMFPQRSAQLLAQWSIKPHCVAALYKPSIQVSCQSQYSSSMSPRTPLHPPHGLWSALIMPPVTISHTNVILRNSSNYMLIDGKRGFSTGAFHGLCQKAKPKPSQEIMETKEKSFGQLTTGEKVARAGKDATYTIVVIIGLGVTGLMFFTIGRELFSGQSPSGVYSKALKMCRKHEELLIAIGEPIKGRGEMNRRGRSRHVSHTKYSRDGVDYMRMKFYIQGPAGSGTVHLEVKKNESGKYEFRYLFAELDDASRRTFVIEDNR